MFPKHPVLLPDFDYLGEHRYFLTWCCFERQALFRESRVVDGALTQILRTCDPAGIAVISYCFMPDHVHMLVEGVEPSADGRRFFRLAKQYSGYAHSQAFGERLWQRYGYEHVVRSTKTSRAVTRYILENPIRAGLARSVGDWPHSGAPSTNLAALVEWAYSEDGWSG
ncbi:MAG: transposase [Acidobacteria bacterium]|nr:transposase [Acidobacteriota bacterium]MSO62976.1 transposase [Acidobacteriota bacterium]